MSCSNCFIVLVAFILTVSIGCLLAVFDGHFLAILFGHFLAVSVSHLPAVIVTFSRCFCQQSPRTVASIFEAFTAVFIGHLLAVFISCLVVFVGCSSHHLFIVAASIAPLVFLSLV